MCGEAAALCAGRNVGTAPAASSGCHAGVRRASASSSAACGKRPSDQALRSRSARRGRRGRDRAWRAPRDRARAARRRLAARPRAGAAPDDWSCSRRSAPHRAVTTSRSTWPETANVRPSCASRPTIGTSARLPGAEQLGEARIVEHGARPARRSARARSRGEVPRAARQIAPRRLARAARGAMSGSACSRRCTSVPRSERLLAVGVRSPRPAPWRARRRARATATAAATGGCGRRHIANEPGRQRVGAARDRRAAARLRAAGAGRLAVSPHRPVAVVGGLLDRHAAARPSDDEIVPAQPLPASSLSPRSRTRPAGRSRASSPT